MVRRREARSRPEPAQASRPLGRRRAAAQPRAQLTAEERNAFGTTRPGRSKAREGVRLCAATDPAAASDAVWAVADALHAAAAILGSGVIRQAADSYARAARVPYARIPGRRRRARVCGRPPGCWPRHAHRSATLGPYSRAGRPARLTRGDGGRATAGAAARRPGRRRAPGRSASHAEHRRLGRKTESRAARSARMVAKLPAHRGPRPHAHGRHEPAWTGPRASRGPMSQAARPHPMTGHDSGHVQGEEAGEGGRRRASLHSRAGRRNAAHRAGQGVRPAPHRAVRSMKIGKLRRITDRHLAEFVASLETPANGRDARRNVGTAR